MKKRSFSLLLALILLLSLLPGTVLAAEEPETYILAGENAQSGALGREPLSKKEIYDLLSAAPLDGSNFYYKPSGAFDSDPSITEPYSPGKVSSSALQGALDRLNALRALAGLPAVTLDSALCENAQYGALAMAYLGTITHYPAQGSTADAFGKLPADIQTKAAEAARTSNLSAGSNLTWAVDSLMDDSDMSNIDRLGHRRWQLNPSMGKIGFGYAVSNSSYSQYVVEKVFDTSRSGQVDYDFVAWPASGNFPNNLSAFNSGTAWSVTLNPKNYSTPSLSSVKVTLTGGGKTWTLSSSSGDGYFNVDTGGYGVSNCIIFCPSNVEKYEGDYTVTVSGLKDKSGKDSTLSYTVSFFDASVDPTDSETPETPTGSDFTITRGVLTEYRGAGGDIVIPDEVTEIAVAVFLGRTDLTSVTIPSSVTTINGGAFCGCTGLTSVVIPSSVSVLPSEGFAGCTGLKSVTISEGVTTINFSAFLGCTSLKSVTIPSSVTSINVCAFQNCTSLKSITIPSSVKEIQTSAFIGCPSLTDIYFGGTQEQWEAIKKGYSDLEIGPIFDEGVNPTVHYSGPDTPTTPTTPSFTDVPADAWYAASVAWAVEKEITNGTSVDKFSPNKTCNTAEILTFLWRACGKPAGGSAGSFTDVADGAWYADAAAWAKSKGMVSGDTLSPDTPCTRASAVMFIWQACGKPAASKTASFSDVPADADYAAAVAWAVEKGVTNGTGADTFSPDTICNRGHIVTFLQRAFAET